jgi:PAS domain S-box-containing protein
LRKAQKNVIEREARIRLLLDSTAEAIFGLGPDGVCTFCNPAGARILRFRSAEELIGRRIHPLIHRPHPDGIPHDEAECPIYSVLRTGQGTHSEDEMWRADGSSFVAEVWSYPIRQEGNIVGTVVTFLDVTDRKHAEQEIRVAAQRREQFLAMLSHELRNPLAAVLSASKIMRSDKITPQLSEKARDVVERQATHMARLLDDLLDVSRITKGGIELRKEDLDFRNIIDTAIEALSPVLADRKAQLIKEVPEDVLVVRGDPARLQQVVVNLLSNAVRYSPAGKRIWLRAIATGDSVMLGVKDEGRGIAREMLSAIFELFVQTEHGLDRSGAGLGIGLTLVRKIVELHGGTVEARSDGPGAGSEFIVTIPLQRHAFLHQVRQSIGAGDSRRIVLVEDQDDARTMLRALLESKGHVVIEQSDGGSALDTINREHPDVALIDIGLPIMNGYDLARKLRENPVLDDVILVALTGYGTAEDIQTARDAGFDNHLVKPADPDLIDQILAPKRAAKAS